MLFLLILKAAQLGVILAKGFLNINLHNEHNEFAIQLINAPYNNMESELLNYCNTLVNGAFFASDTIFFLNKQNCVVCT